MSKKFNLKIATVNNIQSPKTGRDEYRDTKIPELTLRVTSNGTESFSVGKRIKGKYVHATIGRFPANTIEQVRKKAREKLMQWKTVLTHQS